MKSPKIPASLKSSDTYVYRHMGNSNHSTKQMLNFLGYKNTDEFIADVVPEAIALNDHNRFLKNGHLLVGINSETLMLERMRNFSTNNVVAKSFIG